jgi:uncharacterized membrane protein (DUF4010 family)
VVTYLLGALATKEPALASGLGVVTAVVLASRTQMHRLVRDVMTEDELHDLLLFAAAAVIVLPLLPNEEVGPYKALNPFAVWRLVVLVLAVGGTGYVALRALGPRFGLPLAGLAGGFVSSAATIGSMGALAKRQPAVLRPAVAGAVLSTMATVVQMGVVLAATSEETLRMLALPLIVAGAAALAFGMVAVHRLRSGTGIERPGPGRAFDLRGALVFAALLSVVVFMGAAVNDVLGEAGLLGATTLAGFADAHAAGVAAATLVADGKLGAGDAVLPILAGLTSNALTKAIVARVTGGWRFALPVWAGLVAVLGAAWAAAIAGRLA